MAADRFTKKVTLGLGDAVRRLIRLDREYSSGPIDAKGRLERDLLAEALDQYPVNIVMECVDEDGDGIPDDIGIFQKAAKDNCCRADNLLASGKKPSARPKEAGVPKLIRKRSSR